jgi:hypothetical protein
VVIYVAGVGLVTCEKKKMTKKEEKERRRGRRE